MLIITGFFASILAFIYIKLARNVIKLRRQHNVVIGAGKFKDLEQAIRAHGNFNEYVPLGLILLACLEINKIHFLIVFILGALFASGRYLHAKSFLKKDMDIEMRVKGMKATFWSMMLMAGMNLLALVVSFI